MTWLPLASAAEKLKISVKTLRRGIRDGVYPSKLVNGLRYVNLDEKNKGAGKKSRAYLLNVSLNMQELTAMCEEYLDYEKCHACLMDSLPGQEGRPREEDWEKLWKAIDGYSKKVRMLYNAMNFDLDFLLNMHKKMLTIKGVWKQFTSWHSPNNAEIEDEEFTDKEAPALIDKIREDIKKLLFEQN